MKFWQIKNSSQEESELILYGDIMSYKPWWEDGNIITPDDFLDDMKTLTNKSKVTIRLNSCGGDVFAAQAIYAQLKTLAAFKEVIIDGIAASAATIIAMAGDRIKISSGGLYMIHNPSITIWDSFESKDLEKFKSMLDTVKESIIEVYLTRTQLPREEISNLMDEETWMTGKQAVEKGFVDEVMFENKINNVFSGRFLIANNIMHDLSRFKNKPEIEPIDIVEPINKVNQKKGVQAMTLEELKNEYPELIKELTNTARNEGAKEERKRIKSIEQISNNISKELIEEAKYIEPIDAKELAFKALQNDSTNAKTFLNNLENDAIDSGAGDVTGTPGDLSEADEDVKQENIKALAQILNKDKRRVK